MILIKIPKHLSIGPALPFLFDRHKMATSPDGNGVIMFGGYSYSNIVYQDTILELKSDGQGWVGTWTILSAKLQYGRASHVVIPLLMEKNSCELDAIVSSGKYHKLVESIIGLNI